MEKYLVSIITPLYNSEKYIKKTIKSVLNQSYKNWEIIIIDDFSKDKGKKIVKNYAKNYSKINLIELDENKGAAFARNKGIEVSKGRFIAFLDSDDFWHHDKLKKQVKFMLENNYYFTYTKYQLVDKKGNILNKNINIKNKLNYRKLLFTNYIGCLTAMYDTKKLGKVYMPLIRKRQDYALWLKILKKINYGYGLNETLAYYRIHNNSISSNKFELLRYQWKLYRDIENISYLESLTYIFYTIIIKLLRIK